MLPSTSASVSASTHRPSRTLMLWCWNEQYPVGSGYPLPGKKHITLEETDNEIVKVAKIVLPELVAPGQQKFIGYVLTLGNGQKILASLPLHEYTIDGWRTFTGVYADIFNLRGKKLNEALTEIASFGSPVSIVTSKLEIDTALSAYRLESKPCRPRYPRPQYPISPP